MGMMQSAKSVQSLCWSERQPTVMAMGGPSRGAYDAGLAAGRLLGRAEHAHAVPPAARRRRQRDQPNRAALRAAGRVVEGHPERKVDVEGRGCSRGAAGAALTRVRRVGQPIHHHTS